MADPEGCDPWDGNRELKKKAQPEQEEAQAFFAAWFETFSSREVLVKDLELSCQPDGHDYSSVLADAVAELGIAPPRGKAALNVRSMGMWLSAHADRPGPYILRKVEDSRKWYVEQASLPPVDFEPSQEANWPYRSWLANFPVAFSVFGVALERRVLLNCILEMRNSDLLIALRDKYSGDGRQLAEHLQKMMEIPAYGADAKPMTQAEWLRQNARAANADPGDDQLAAMWLFQTIRMIAWAADRERPVGPVYEQARERFNSLSKKTQGRENVALEVLFEADRQLGGLGTEEVLEQKSC